MLAASKGEGASLSGCKEGGDGGNGEQRRGETGERRGDVLMSSIESYGGMHSAIPEKTLSVGSASRSVPRSSGKYETSMRGSRSP
jgi:hypothetical protein